MNATKRERENEASSRWRGGKRKRKEEKRNVFSLGLFFFLVVGTILSAVDKLSSVHSFSRNEGLFHASVLVGMSERDLGQGGSSSGVVDDFLHDSFDVTVSLGMIKSSVLGSSFSVGDVSLERARSNL